MDKLSATGLQRNIGVIISMTLLFLDNDLILDILAVIWTVRQIMKLIQTRLCHSVVSTQPGN